MLDFDDGTCHRQAAARDFYEHLINFDELVLSEPGEPGRGACKAFYQGRGFDLGFVAYSGQDSGAREQERGTVIATILYPGASKALILKGLRHVAYSSETIETARGSFCQIMNLTSVNSAQPKEICNSHYNVSTSSMARLASVSH